MKKQKRLLCYSMEKLSILLLVSLLSLQKEGRNRTTTWARRTVGSSGVKKQ